MNQLQYIKLIRLQEALEPAQIKLTNTQLKEKYRTLKAEGLTPKRIGVALNHKQLAALKRNQHTFRLSGVVAVLKAILAETTVEDIHIELHNSICILQKVLKVNRQFP
jgi:hypothetical protein